jgi:hypothetical protein
VPGSQFATVDGGVLPSCGGSRRSFDRNPCQLLPGRHAHASAALPRRLVTRIIDATATSTRMPLRSRRSWTMQASPGTTFRATPARAPRALDTLSITIRANFRCVNPNARRGSTEQPGSVSCGPNERPARYRHQSPRQQRSEEEDPGTGRRDCTSGRPRCPRWRHLTQSPARRAVPTGDRGTPMSSKGQVTIPRQIRDALNRAPGCSYNSAHGLGSFLSGRSSSFPR